ncbi:putative NAD(P)H dehydrogenase (quinone) FQR1-like 1 [Glycine soja]|uniref:NAD(P)H dehydrogenase (quinone) n=1 Tax=Glycine soja TaxID=3848 RepID=A0A445HQD6_GLYSO|nr:putative NAD(P)H dehydrogenase (quinone) FQR1-like 1 [Glycine soja]
MKCWRSDEVPDAISLDNSLLGVYSARSGYRWLIDKNHEHSNTRNWLWKSKLPENILFFIWQCRKVVSFWQSLSLDIGISDVAGTTPSPDWCVILSSILVLFSQWLFEKFGKLETPSAWGCFVLQESEIGAVYPPFSPAVAVYVDGSCLGPQEETILFHKYAAIIAAIKELLRRQWSVNLLHFLKDGNACVDILAKMGNQHLCYYAMHGNEERLAKEVEKGANSVEGVEGKLWQASEFKPIEFGSARLVKFSSCRTGSTNSAKSELASSAEFKLARSAEFVYLVQSNSNQLVHPNLNQLVQTNEVQPMTLCEKQPKTIVMQNSAQSATSSIVEPGMVDLSNENKRLHQLNKTRWSVLDQLKVPETLSAEELAKLGEPTKAKSDVPIITPNELSKADGFFFGFPIIFGKMASQFKAFIDETGDLWKAEELAAKPAGILITTCCQGGGKEIVHTAITQLEKHRMIYVSTEIGYIYCTGMVKENEVEEKGEGTYGAGTYNGRVTNRSELADAFQRGVCIAVITKMFKEAAA